MIIKNITQLGNPLLRTKAQTVKKFDAPEIKKTVKNLVETMRQANLVGICAPQIGISFRIFVSEIRPTKYRKDPGELDGLQVYINPVIVKSSKKTTVDYEGCGSVGRAAVFGQVKRPESVTVRAFNDKGEEFERTVTGLLARVIQHEVDHLNGVVFTDKLVSIKSLISVEEYVKMMEKGK
ncbi:MAG: peptide deformylase [Candidatus Vogelbacteria bacterium]|nr:peptide deformylase [Candidatus Vogelbacteria bacterium]